MLPIDPATTNYSAGMIAKFDKLVAPKGYPWKLTDILPKVLPLSLIHIFISDGSRKLV